jgi:Xaa-Pro aminopeptidase
MMAKRDKRVYGQFNTQYEPGVDMRRLRYERLDRVQAEMAARGYGALLLSDNRNVRYCTGVAVMPIWSAINLAHYVLVPVEGSPILYEYGHALHRAEHFWDQVRPVKYHHAHWADDLADELSGQWAAEIKDILQEWGVADAKLGLDIMDFEGFVALQGQGLNLADADSVMEEARIIKTMDEIELLRQSATVAEACLHEMQTAIRPGITENELMGVYWERMLAAGGEFCSTRLLVSGYKTNPWFHEAGSKMVRPGDLVAIDTDMTGPEGYLCDISRTFLCGDKPTPAQKEAYQVAYDFVMATIELCKPGISFAELAAEAPQFPEDYKAQRYPLILHGIGLDDEPPNIVFPDRVKGPRPEGILKENMVVAVEAYAGKVGAQDGVKLEEEVWITAEGPVVISLYPYEDKLLL